MIESKLIMCFACTESTQKKCRDEIACHFQTTTGRPYIRSAGKRNHLGCHSTIDIIILKMLPSKKKIVFCCLLHLDFHHAFFFFLREELLCLSLRVKTQTNKQTFLEFVLFISRPVLQCHLGDLDGKHDWKTFKLQLRLIALDQPEYYQDWSIVKHSNVLRCVLCVVQPGGSREDACEALGALKR